MGRSFENMMGNRRLLDRLEADLRANSLSHAYIIEGDEGFGKHTLALQLSAALECANRTDPNAALPCGDCPSCRKILSGNSPDVIFISRGDKATLGVETIRSMHADVCIAPNDGDNKIYVIEEAHLMTVQAQNAFLLTLEEPPAYVRFFLLCSSAASLLETVRSRAPTLRLEPIPTETVDRFLCDTERAAKQLREQAPAEFRELLIASHGSIGRAKALLDPKARKPILQRRASAREFIKLCTASHNSGAVLAYLNTLGQKRDEILLQLEEITVCVRDLFVCKQTERATLCFFSDREEALSLACRFSAPALLRISEGLEHAADSLRSNANVRLTLTAMAMELGLLS